MVLAVLHGKRRPDLLKKGVTKMVQAEDNDMRAEYDFTGGVRGKHHKAMQAGYTITNFIK